MEAGEPIDTVFPDEDWECPFLHEKNPTFVGENVMPPVDGKETNDASKLGKALAAESARMETIDIEIKVGTRTHKEQVQYTAHHLIPGNESWPKTKLLKWVDEAKGMIKKDIGYSVNHTSNGVDLPGIHGLGKPAWSASSRKFQQAYAFAAMASSDPLRQFHDRHAAYSRYVVKVLNKINEKLSEKEKPGCGKKYCGGSKTKKFDPPEGLVERLNDVALRLKEHLCCAPRGWKKPIITSRFAWMYKNRYSGMTQDQAREELRAANF